MFMGRLKLLNPHQLELFLLVAQNSSFSKAAESLEISQPSVSIQIKRLENSLGVRLFERLGQSVHLTSEGKIILEYAKQFDNLVTNLSSDLEDLKGLKMGRVRVGASRVPSTTTIPLAFALFKNQYPQAEIVITTGMSTQVEGWVLDNEVDVGIIGGATSSDMIIQERLYEEELVLVLPVRHPLAQRGKINPKDVVNEPVLLPYAGRLTEYLQKCFLKKRVVLKQLVTLGSREAVRTALTAGYGVSILPSSAADQDTIAGVLITKRIEGMRLKFPVSIIYRKDKHLSRMGTTFLDFLRNLGPSRSLQSSS
jgi:DNA-binding transcriptional LysR family regulator